MRLRHIIPSLLVLAACSTQVPDTSLALDNTPNIFPDYTDVTVPSNIAPLNFRIQENADRFITVMSAGAEKMVTRGDKVIIPANKWNRLKEHGTVSVQVYAFSNGSWSGYKPFSFTISDEIDPYISYRIIMPSIESYERLSINQRDLTSFKEKTIYANQMVQDASNGQCINCHHYRNYTTHNMQFHARQFKGGTIMVIDGELRKVNLKTDSTISAGVYPSWHPTHNYIAYSTNRTYQELHSNHSNRVEVFDEYSDLILYDTEKNSVSIIENDSTELECFPYWAPDGRTLYYVSAHIDNPSGFYKSGGVAASTQDIRYNLYSKPFAPDDKSWGKRQLLIRADSINKSITLPRVSPSGRWLMFTMGNQGVFHIWHKESDLYLMDLKNGEYRSLDEINSQDVESYHSWSSNGRWVIFSSRRDDGVFTRLFLTHMSEDGHFSKPFALPQKDPEFSRKYLYSFNIPEFTVEPVKVSARVIASFVKSNDAQAVSFEQK